MRDFMIATDSNMELSPETIAELGLTVAPMPFEMDGKAYANYPDGREMDAKEFYKLLREGKTASTSQLNEATFTEYFESILKQDKDLLYIGFSSGLSGTYYQGTLAADALRQKYPNAKIITVDSLSASVGEGLLVYMAAKMKSDGKTIEEVAKWVEDNRLHVCHWFTVDDLNHLKRGGRVSPAAALVGTMLGIKPVLKVDDSGKLIPVAKVRGRQKALEALVDEMEKSAINPAEQIVFISQADCLDDALKVQEMIKNRLHVKEFMINMIGPVIGSHAGPGTLALMYLGNHR